jgi:hypothetical protein
VHVIEWAPHLLLGLAAIAIGASVWFAVRRPSPTREFGRASWQTGQVCCAALSAILAAVCVLGGLALLN